MPILVPICVALARGAFPAWCFAAALALQLVLVRRSASVYGIRFVGTVLARASVAKQAGPSRRGRKAASAAPPPATPPAH